MSIPTEPIGSIPRPLALIEAMANRAPGDPVLEAAYDTAIRETLLQFEATGSPVVTDGEQRKYRNFWTYSVEGLPNASPDGFLIPFAAGHTRRMPRLTGKGFRLALSRFSAADRQRIGVHTCPGADRDSTRGADIAYAALLPSLFELKAGNFYVALAGENDRVRVLDVIRRHVKPDQRVFVGVVAPIDPRIESPEEVRDRVLEAAAFIPLPKLGTADDCGFAPFSDDTSTSRATAFAKIRARVLGTALAASVLEGRS